MSYFRHLVATPFFWIFFAGIFGGFLVRNIVSMARSTEKRAKENSFLYLLFNLTMIVLLATAAILFPESYRILDIRLLYLFLVTSVIIGAAILFPLAVGAPLLLVFSLIGALWIIATIPLHNYYGSECVAMMYGIDSDGDSISVEYRTISSNRQSSSSQPQIFTVRGDHLAVEAVHVRYDDLLIPMSNISSLYIDRLVGVDIGTDMHEIEIETGIVASMYDSFIEVVSYLPGIETKRIRAEAIAIRAAQQYKICIGPDAQLMIVE